MRTDLPARTVIAGGTGFLGQSLARFLETEGGEVIVLGRRPPDGRPTARTRAGSRTGTDARSGRGPSTWMGRTPS